MIATYISAALICALSLLVGRSLLAALGLERWSWLEPATGLAALFAVAGFFARAPGHATTAGLFIVLLLVAAAALLGRPYGRGESSRGALGAAIAIAALLAIPFAINARWGLIGVGFNNDLGLHLAWAEWLKNGLGPRPDTGYPLGPHALATTISAIPGIGLDRAFMGVVIAIPVLTGLTALAALRGLAPGRRALAAVLTALPYLAASYFAQSAFKETAEALFVLAFAIALPAAWPIPSDRAGRLRTLGPLVVLAAGIVFSYSIAGLAWPIATIAIYSLSIAEIRQALAPRQLRRTIARPWILGAVALAAIVVVGGLVGPFGFGRSFAEVQGANTFGPVNPSEALGFWTSSNYRLDTAGGAHLPWLTSAIGALALFAGLAWWLGRREYAVPAALAGGFLIYLATLLPLSGDYVRAKALMIIAPLVMLIAVRALLSAPPAEWRVPRAAWAALGVVFVIGAAYSSLLVLRDTPVGPPGHGAELRAFASTVDGKSVLYAGQDRFAQWELRGSDTEIPLIENSDNPTVQERPTKPFDTGVSYSPIDFDSFNSATLDRFDYVVTTRAAYASKSPPNFTAIARTPSYILWKRTGRTPRKRTTLLEGGAPAAPLDCNAPEARLIVGLPGRASIYPAPVIGPKEGWDNGFRLGLGESTSQILSLPAGRSNFSLQYFSPVPIRLTITPVTGSAGYTLVLATRDGKLPAALDGQRPNQLSLFNDGQYWPAGSVDLPRAARLRFTVSVDDPSTLQRLSGYGGEAFLGELTARPVGPERNVALKKACGSWVDHYSGGRQP